MKSRNLGYQRNKEVDAHIDKAFQTMIELQTEEEHGFAFTGSTSYSFLLNGLELNSNSILRLRSQATNEPLVVLDVGAGDFQFSRFNDRHYKGRVITYGIAANDIFRVHNEHKKNEYEVFDNAEYLNRIFGENKFDCIFSRRTFIHFVDPIGSIIEAYKTLKPGGVILIDSFSVPGCESYTADIINYLKSQGYHVTAGDCHSTIQNFVIQKIAEKPYLDFPLQFNDIGEDHVIYKPTEALVEYHRSAANANVRLIYENARQLIQDRIKKFPELDFLNKCDNLPNLFANPQYQKLNLKLQHLSILAVVSKFYNYSSYIDMISVGEKVDEHAPYKGSFMNLYNDIMSTGQSMLPFLHNNPSFNSYLQNNDVFSLEEAGEQQLRIVALAAIRDFLNLEKQERTKEELEEMNLPYTASDRDEFMNDNNQNWLLFPHLANHLEKESSQEFTEKSQEKEKEKEKEKDTSASWPQTEASKNNPTTIGARNLLDSRAPIKLSSIISSGISGIFKWDWNQSKDKEKQADSTTEGPKQTEEQLEDIRKKKSGISFNPFNKTKNK